MSNYYEKNIYLIGMLYLVTLHVILSEIIKYPFINTYFTRIIPAMVTW